MMISFLRFVLFLIQQVLQFSWEEKYDQGCHKVLNLVVLLLEQAADFAKNLKIHYNSPTD